MTIQLDQGLVIGRLHRAWNTHDLDALVACFHPDYESLQPLHPDRCLCGNQRASQLGRNLQGRPQPARRLAPVRAQAISSGRSGAGAYVEGHPFEAGGVMIFGIVDDQITWAQVYTDTIQIAGPDFDLILDEILRRERSLQ